MVDGNLVNNRDLAGLLNPDRNSYARVFRVMFDERLPGLGIDTDLFYNDSPFMNILTNTLINMSGWPDMASPTHTSDPGLFKEEIAWVDGVNKVRYAFDITCNFQNIEGDPINSLFQYWTTYASLAFMGGISMRNYFITRNRIYFAYKFAKPRTKFAIYRESFKFLFKSKWQRRAVIDFYIKKLNKGSWK
jgi:hypothetical protein